MPKMAENGLTELGDLPVMLAPKQAAEIAGVTTMHITNLLKSGELEGVKLGGCWRISRDYYLRYLGLAD